MSKAESQHGLCKDEFHEQSKRLIDHFKRAYQIIVGLSITLACGKLFYTGTVSITDQALWLFCIFFITVVPIFHGGDRSLDIKYLGVEVDGFWRRSSYIWDVYMLLLTAIFFVKIAQAIPGPGVSFTSSARDGEVSATSSATLFYEWMAAMLIFDTFVLIVDVLKTGVLNRTDKISWRSRLVPYCYWVPLNLTLAVACLYAAGVSALPCLTADRSVSIGISVFLLAFARTVLDYVVGKNFMFPQLETNDGANHSRYYGDGI